jgi:type II secretory pathway component PulF
VNEALGPFTLILLVIPAIALRIAITALYGRRPMAAADPMQMVLSLSATVMLVLAGMGLIVGLLGWSLLFFPLPIMFLIVVVMVIDRSRRMEHRSLLWALATAAQRGIALSEAARAYADELPGDTGLRAMALAEALERGEPLSRAVRSARLRLGAASTLGVRMGESLGLLGPALGQQLDDSQQTDAAMRESIGRFFYLGIVLIVLTGAVGFIMWKIVPVFQKMFEEFGLKLPAPTLLVINVSKWYVTYGWLVTAPITAIAPLFLFGGCLYYIGWFPRDLPLVWRFFKRYDGALVMRGLSLAISRGMPLPQAMRLVADCYPIRVVAGLVRTAADQVAAGVDWRQSLLAPGLIGAADAAVLGAAERAGNLPWALNEMADSAIRRQTYFLQALLQLLFPVLLVMLGMVIGMFVISLFLPLISLIQGLS